MARYSIEPKPRKYVKGYGFYHLQENIKKIIGYRTRCCKHCLQKVVHKAGEFIGNKIANIGTMSNDDNIEKQEPVEEAIIQSEKRDEILNKLRKLL